MFRKISTLLFLGTSLSLFGQKYSNDFLNIGVGAKGQALGGAVVANIGDVTAGYWNPAALANLEHKQGLQIGAMHTSWSAGGSNYDYLGFAVPLQNGKRAIGLNIIRFGIDNIPNTLRLYEDGTLNLNNLSEFSAADYAFLGTYAQNMKLGEGEFSMGSNVKVIRRVIGSFAKAWGFGLDAGFQYRIKGFRAGLVAKDFTNTFNSWQFSLTDKEKLVFQQTGNEIPVSEIETTAPSIVLGIGYQKKIGKVGIGGEIDATMTTDGRRNTLLSGDPISMNPAAGLELSYDNLVFVRAGVSNFQKDNTFDKKEFWTMQPAIGLGLKIRGITLDYAYSNVGSSEARFYSNTVSLILNIKPKQRAGLTAN